MDEKLKEARANDSVTSAYKITNGYGHSSRPSRPRSDNRIETIQSSNHSTLSRPCDNNNESKYNSPNSIGRPNFDATNRSTLSVLNRSMGLSADQLPADLLGRIEGEPLRRGENKVVEILRQEVLRLRKELLRQRDLTIAVKIRENQLQERLCEQAKRQLDRASTRFEDLNLGANRPTQLVRRYGNLYSEARVDAMDGLDLLTELSHEEDLKIKLLLSILVLSFRSAQKCLLETRMRVRELLQVPQVLKAASATGFSDQTDRVVRDMEDSISLYLRKTVEKQDLAKISHDVAERVYLTLYDYPILRRCSALCAYIDECVHVAWALCLQNPPIGIDYESKVFSADRHNRFHTSDPDSDSIKAVLWPTLIEGDGGANGADAACLSKGIVIT